MSEMVTKDLGPVSSYAIAVEHGYQGTEAQWIAELQATTQNAATATSKAAEAAVSAGAAAGAVKDARAWAEGTRDGQPVPSTDPAYHNSAAYYKTLAETAADAAAGSAQDAAAGAVDAESAKTAAQTARTGAETARDAAQTAQAAAEAWATGSSGGTATESNNAKAYAEAAAAVAASIPEDYSELSRETLAAFPQRSAEGSVVTIRDGADGIPAAALTAKIALTQYGTGPTPAAPRPVEGFTGLTVYRGRRNLMDGVPTATGAIIDDGTETDASTSRRTGLIPAAGMSTVTVRVANASSGSWILRVHTYNAAGEWTGMAHKQTMSSVKRAAISVTVTGAAYIRLSMAASSAVSVGVYDPASLTSIPVNWTSEAGAIGAGSLDLMTGILTVTHKYLQLDGTETWTAAGTDPYYHINLTGDTVQTIVPDAAICSHFVDNPTIGSSNHEVGFRVFRSSNNRDRLLVRPGVEGVTDTETWKTWLAAQAAANKPVQVAYELLTPETCQLTPQQITTLRGTNLLLCDTCELAVTWRVDPTMYGGAWKEAEWEAYGIPVLYLEGDTAAMTKEDAVTLSYRYGTRTGTLSCKWQGSSSLRYPKKNLNVTFDSAFDAWTDFKAQVNAWRSANNVLSSISDTNTWGSGKKYVLKADWVDPSHLRNVGCARLWGQIVASRSTVDSHLSAAPNYGAIDGFPIAVVLNGSYQGVYSFTVKKDAPLLGMGEGAAEYAVSAESNAQAACWWRTTAVMDGTDYDVEYAPDGVETSTICASLNAAISAALAAGASWETDMASLVDIDSLIDYYIFTVCIAGQDNYGHNCIYSTYDGAKWLLNAYDLDSTFGLDAYGTAWSPAWSVSSSDRNPRFDKVAGNGSTTGHRLFYLAYTYSKARLKTRYQALRAGALSDANVWLTLSNLGNLIPTDLLARERAVWPALQGTSLATVSQYMEYYRMHCAALDAQVAAWEV